MLSVQAMGGFLEPYVTLMYSQEWHPSVIQFLDSSGFSCPLLGECACTKLCYRMSVLFVCGVEALLIVQSCKKTNLMHNLLSVCFVNLYMLRAYLGSSSGGTTVCIQYLVLIILFR